MYEITCIYLLNGEAFSSEKTYYPPDVGDIIEFSGADPNSPKRYAVIKRTWKQTFTTTNEALDIEMEEVEEC